MFGWRINPGPAELGYVLPLQTLQKQISWLLKKPNDLDLHCLLLTTVELQWLEHWWLVYHGLFELIFESLRNFSDSSSKQILSEIFLFYYEIACCVYSLESPHSNGYMQHTIIFLKIENISKNYPYLGPDLAPWLNLIGLNYLSLEQISMIPKMFKPLKFDCMWICINNLDQEIRLAEN